MYDIAIVGLGPAGSNFARLIDSNKYKVIAFDKKELDSNKHRKPCGGLLSPSAQRSLAKFNLSIPGNIIASPQIFFVKTIDMDNNITNNYQRFYLNINRHKFDLWLMSLIPDSVTVCSGSTVTKIEKVNDGYEITYQRNDKIQKVRTKHIVGSAGTDSIVTKQFKKDKTKYRVCIQEWFQQNDKAPFFSCIFDSKNSDSYSWSLHKDGYLIFGGAYDTHNAKQAFNQQKLKLKEYGINITSQVKKEACLVVKLRSPKDFCLGKDRICILGEAAGFISPSSYEGISGALDSSYLLSQIFNAGDKDILKRYQKSTIKLRSKYLLKVLKANILCNTLLRKWIMKSKIKNLNLLDQ